MATKENENTLHAIVRGRVQGVGFRYFVSKCAGSLKISGTVRNLPDGSVEVKASGDRASLDQLVERLWKGPMFSRVSSVETMWDAPVESMDGFLVTD